MKFKFLSLTSIFGSAVISVLSLATTYEFVQAGPSSYPTTCNEEKLSGAGDVLFATCKNSDGNEKSTSIKLRGIYNIDGRLVQNILNSNNSFIKSCSHRSLKNGILAAICLNENQEHVKTHTILQEITNRNGKLEYEFDNYISETAKKIANGHAYRQHVTEFETDQVTPAQSIFEKMALDVIRKKEDEKNLADGRKAYWKKINPSNYLSGKSKSRGTILIVNPRDPDRGTMFVPNRGKTYFNNLR